MSLREPVQAVFGYNSRMFYEGLDCAFRSSTQNLRLVYGLRNDNFFTRRINDLKLTFNLIMIELEFVDDPAIQYAREIRNKFPDIPILTLANLNPTGKHNTFIETGISGIVLKKCSLQDLIYATGIIQKGTNFFCGAVTQMLMDELKQKEINEELAITRREKDILKHLVNGQSNQKIASEFGISISTVKTHRQHIMEKLGAGNVLELLRNAHFNNILDPADDPLSTKCSLLCDCV